MSCAHHQTASEPMPVVYEEPAVEIDSCACAYAPEPCREIQRPRIVEEVPAEPAKRPCDNHQTLNCGCGNCDTFHPHHPGEPIENAEIQAQPTPVATFIPAQPRSYELASNRAFNRFIKDTYDIYSQKPNLTIHVNAPIAKDNDLPGGIEKGVEAFKTHLQNAHAFVLTDDAENADYTLKTTAEWFDTESKTVPAIKYVVEMFAKDGTPAGAWSQIVKRADNKSWL